MSRLRSQITQCFTQYSATTTQHQIENFQAEESSRRFSPICCVRMCLPREQNIQANHKHFILYYLKPETLKICFMWKVANHNKCVFTDVSVCMYRFAKRHSAVLCIHTCYSCFKSNCLSSIELLATIRIACKWLTLLFNSHRNIHTSAFVASLLFDRKFLSNPLWVFYSTLNATQRISGAYFIQYAVHIHGDGIS